VASVRIKKKGKLPFSDGNVMRVSGFDTAHITTLRTAPCTKWLVLAAMVTNPLVAHCSRVPFHRRGVQPPSVLAAGAENVHLLRLRFKKE